MTSQTPRSKRKKAVTAKGAPLNTCGKIEVPVLLGIWARISVLTETGMYGADDAETAAQLLAKAVREEKDHWR